MTFVQEIQQQKLLLTNREQEHAFKVEQFKSKLEDVGASLEKQDKETKKLSIRITATKEEYEAKTKRIK